MDSVAKEILTFWFGTHNPSSDIERRDVWFKSTPEFDGKLISDFTGIHERAANGELDYLSETAAECLALIIALDQFPRNIYRGTPRAFDADPKARDIARFALDRGYDRDFTYCPRVFTYLPFEHSEELVDQERALVLFTGLNDERARNSAIGHHDAIRRFGRFPHRNRVLGRENTPEEEEYLKDPPTWGMTAAEAAELEERKKREAEQEASR